MRALFRSRLAACGLLAMLAATVAALGPFTSPQPATAQPAGQIPIELQYVPADAALFLHADVATIWTSDLLKSFRAADKDTFSALEAQATKLFGVKIDGLKSLTLFIPELKMGEDAEKLGVIVTFTKAYDKAKLTEGVTKLFPPNTKPRVLTPSEKVAVILVGLDDKYGKPRVPADGPLTLAIKAAASGKHTIVAGSTLANLPDALRSDDLPGQVRAFQPIFKADSIFATLDLGKSLTLDVRVKAKTETRAVDAEKALGILTKLLSEELSGQLPMFEKDA